MNNDTSNKKQTPDFVKEIIVSGKIGDSDLTLAQKLRLFPKVELAKDGHVKMIEDGEAHPSQHFTNVMGI